VDAAHPVSHWRDWVERAAPHFGLEAETIEVTSGHVAMSWTRSPAIAPAANADGVMTGFLVILGMRAAGPQPGAGIQVELLTPDGAREEAPSAVLFEPVAATESGHDALRRLLSAASVDARRCERACAHLSFLPGQDRGREIWRLVAPTDSRIAPALVQAAGPALLLFLASHAVATFLWLLSWWLIGTQALAGHFDQGWVGAWALCLLSLVPPQLVGLWAEGLVAIRIGRLLRQRFLRGALGFDPDHIRHEGAGLLYGRVMEANNFEGLALSGGFLTFTAAIELVAATVVLGLGAGGVLHAGLLLAFVLAAAGLSANHWHRRRHASDVRLQLTHGLVERMVGHRTRLALMPQEHWPGEEDPDLARYGRALVASDDTLPRLLAGLPRVWLVASIVALIPAMAHGVSAGHMAAALGGTLFGFAALADWCHGLVSAAGAVIAWRRAAPFLTVPASEEHGAAVIASLAPIDATLPAAEQGGNGGQSAALPLIDGVDLWYRYQGRTASALAGVSLRVGRGDRVLVVGPSGGGKSTLVSVLAGQRLAAGGRLLLQGLDRPTLGFAEWRRRVASAPQFHENYLFSESLAFNLLLGRRWPPSDHDLQEAHALCCELGLGDLIERMPAGLFQWVGETGWQLSHGERSRVYLARAVLQGAQVVLLDESLSALDAENLMRCFRVAAERSPALVVVTHE
jgi:ATP-binding cassette subfamily B protein